MSRDDIAIIGAACLLPEADSLDAFHDNLWAGRDSVKPPTAERIRHTGGTPDITYVPMGYLDRVDLFDHQFFGISLREAELMDPAQRLALQLAHHAIESSGRAPRDLRGSRTAVILSGTDSGYGRLTQDSDPQQILGLLPAALAARVSYLFDLVGPALVLDTACSGSMAAVALAVEQLRGGHARMALAGGVSAQPDLLPREGHVPMRGVESPDGVCRPFDAAANGTTGGEGGGILLLKPLADALADDDAILAVLKGIATNHNGFRAASMSAPSQVAQTEAITAAWRDAGVDPRTIAYVECHGSGTPLGDVVEVEALRRAFLDSGVDGPRGAGPKGWGAGETQCAIGSVKGNVGHLDHAAGMAGLFKALSSVRRGVLYPTLHFRSPNPLIDFTGPVHVNATGRTWDGGSPRRAGISSFGLTGTNVHAVLEQPPPAEPQVFPPSTELVTVSAKSASALRRYCQRLADFAARTDHPLRTLAHAMNRCRDDYPYRLAFVAESTAELAAALRSADVPDQAVVRDRPVVLLFSGDGRIDDDLSVTDLDPDLDGAERTPAGRLAARQYALYRLVRSLGLTDTRLAGSGVGNLVVRLCRGELSPVDAIGKAAGEQVSAEVDQARLRQTVRDFVRVSAVLVEMGRDGVLSRQMRRLAPELPVVPLVAGGILHQLGRIYELGGTVDWERYYEGARIPRIEAPTYPFEPVRCWVGPSIPPPARTGAQTDGRIAAIWSQVLKADGVGPDSNYFELGGTSIAGITVLRDIEQEFGVHLTFGDLYGHPTVRQLAGAVDGLRGAAEPDSDLSIVPIPRGGRLPLSFGQEQLWFLDQLNPDSPLYNVPHDIRWRGPLDYPALAAAVRDLGDRHEVLRTCVRSDDGEPYVLDTGRRLDLPLVDLSALPEAERDREARRLIDAEATVPIDLENGPLVRTTLLKLADDDHVLLDTWHHSIFDGWSPVPFLRDLMELYLARLVGREHASSLPTPRPPKPDLPDLPVQYADFAAWHRSWLSGERLERGLAYWRESLAGMRRDELPLDRPRPAVRGYAGDLIEFTVDTGTANRVREFSRQEGVTTFVTMLAVVDTLIHRWAGLDDVVVGVGTSGRFNPATHDLIGYFNNVLPFRTDVDGGKSFRDLVRRCATTVAGVLDHEWIPLEKVVSALCRSRDAARHPLFDIAYTHQNAPSPTTSMAGVDLSLFDGNIAGIPPGTAKFDLTLGITDQDGGPMHGYLEYATGLFERSSMERLATWFETLITSTMDTPDQALGQLSLSGDSLIVDMVEAHAAERPEHPAVVHAGRTHTYAEVNRAANRLARRLVEAGVTTETPVPVIAERSVDLVVGWLAVAKAGGAYVPVDPELPAARIQTILGEVDPRIVVAGAGLAPDAPHRITIELTGAGDPDPPRRAGAGNLAYITYTSGSTGRPHGCEVDHGNLANLLRWYQEDGDLRPDDRFSQLVSPGFDAAVLEIWGALCCGATIHFAQTALQEPGALLRWMAEEGVTVAMLPTPLAEVVLTEGTFPPDLRLRLMLAGGDRLRARPPAGTGFRLVNIYGPTECTVISTAGDVSTAPADELPDIGRPITNTRAYIMDSRGEPVPPGELGELYVGGAGVGRGYHRLPAVTAARFVADPFTTEPGARMYRTGDLARLRPDQNIEFCGRTDNQMEVRGNRVEPAEIERILVSHPRVREAVVVAVPGPDGSPRLVAHVTGGPPPPSEQELVAWTTHALPAYMVPSRVLVHDRLPRTSNGKFDRRSMVTDMTTTMDGYAERVLTGIVAELLGHDQVGPHDNFFELGGDSVLGVRVAARAAKAGVNLTPQQLLQYHTLRELAAAAVVEPLITQDPVPAVPAVPAGSAGSADRPPSLRIGSQAAPIRLIPIMHRFFDAMGERFGELASRTGKPGGDFVVAQVLEAATGFDGDAVRAAMEHLVALHEPLRYRFRRNSLGWRIECAETERATFADVKVLPPMTEEEELAVVEADCAALRSEVDIERGPVIRVRYYDRGRRRTGLVLLLIHHFVFDNMAIIAILDDLDTALGDLDAGRRLVATPRPAGWREWVDHLHDMALSDELAGELEYWTGILRAGETIGGRPGGEVGLVTRSIDPDHVAPVLRRSGATSHEAAYCAMACGLARWRGTSSAYVITEGEATPNAYRPKNRAPAVGWFTTLHPLLLPVEPGATAAECLPAIADRIRSVPNDGVGYGILRYLTPPSPRLAELRALAEPVIMINHMATDGSSFDQGVRRWRSRFDLHSRLKKADTAGFGIVITTSVHGGPLSLGVAYDGRFDTHEMAILADHIIDAFDELGRAAA